MTVTLSGEELVGLLRREFNDDREAAVPAFREINRWLKRGDGVAVYRNEDLGSHEVGRLQFVSYGSIEAQLVDLPPTKLPDIGAHINWRYQLYGTYRGALLALWQ